MNKQEFIELRRMNDKKINVVISPKGYGKCYKEYKNVIDYLENKINNLEKENQQLKEIITEARKYIIIELLDDNLEWHRNNYSNITGSDLPNDSILKLVDILEKVGEIE